MSTFDCTNQAAFPVHADRPVWTATGLEPQVFLDRSGRRAGRVRVGGAVAAVAAAGWLCGIVSGAAGFSSLPALPATLAAKTQPHLVATQRHRGVVHVASAERVPDRS